MQGQWMLVVNWLLAWEVKSVGYGKKSYIVTDTFNIVPFYKNKGAKTYPKNFRPITILSCFGKLFTSVLNNRLNTFSDEFLLLNENQTGFCSHYILMIWILFLLVKMRKGLKAFPKTSKTIYKFMWNYLLFFMPTIQYFWQSLLKNCSRS